MALFGWIVRTLLLCFVVGLVLSFLDITPANILTNTWVTIRDIASLSRDALVSLLDAFRWAVPYILIGAVIVVPLSLLGVVLRWSRSRHRL
ncbi:DUF6460 domain-containing protein [Azospirillum canadense]|uniref:DUF6460 domain-containing protein n=1 Tax=Azospirillum canadense TaxID=403962 RepID=UPI002226444B|nr:DUF6460 domain-containing protein [Azospirillum canadense]MCW2237052.1 hypothetical protein [Azospirillum canadense]